MPNRAGEPKTSTVKTIPAHNLQMVFKLVLTYSGKCRSHNSRPTRRASFTQFANHSLAFTYRLKLNVSL